MLKAIATLSLATISMFATVAAAAEVVILYRHNNNVVTRSSHAGPPEPEEPEETNPPIFRSLTSCAVGASLQDLFSAAEWASESSKTVTIPVGSICGGTQVSYSALSVGSSSWKGNLALTVNGEIQAAGGSKNGGNGGHALNLNQVGDVGQKLNLVVNGAIRAGGGGGGIGGDGGETRVSDEVVLAGGRGGNGEVGRGYNRPATAGVDGGKGATRPEIIGQSGSDGGRGGDGGDWGAAGEDGQDGVNGKLATVGGMPGLSIITRTNATITNNGIIQP